MQRFAQTTGTREYNFEAATLTATGATSTAALALGTLGKTREVMVMATEACFVRFGASNVAAAVGTDANVLRVLAGERFHLKLNAAVTHFTAIRATSDGVLHITPVI